MDNDYKYDSDDQLLRTFLQQHAAQPTGRASFRRRVMLHLPDTIYHIGLCLELAGGVDESSCEIRLMGSRDDLPGIAANIFALLREFDETDVDIILAEGLPGQDIGLAIMNRLSKASGYHIIRC